MLERMNVLVAYASKHGSTAEIAEAIAEKIRESGLIVDCMPLAELRSLEGYDAVVLGSALYAGHWRGEATWFLRKHREQLSEHPLWVFSSGPVGQHADALDPRRLEPKRIVAQLEALGAREHVVFGGCLPATPRGPLERAVVSRTPRAYRDQRYWAEIRAWGAQIAAELVESDLSASSRP